MNNDSRNIMPGDRVKVFDRHVYIDDVTTPLSMTMQPATVMCRYGKKSIYNFNIWYDDYGYKHGEPTIWKYPDLIDVRFDYRPEHISHGHFTNGVEVMV